MSELNDQEETVDVRDLDSLLKRSLNDNTLQVVDYRAVSLLPPGENYCSIMIKLDVKIRRNASEEIMHFVAKTPNPSGNSIVEWPLIFKKELFMYAELRRLYRELEKQTGMNENEIINVWPEYVGYRNSLKDGDKIDDDSLLLMENINTQGFYNVDRKKGLDVHHAGKALALLARYHALGIVMKQRRPSFAKKAIEQALVLGFDIAFTDQGFDSVLNTIVKTACLQKHLSVIKSSFERSMGGRFYPLPLEPWASINHGDFWVNNMLFHKDEAGHVDDVKFVDFQVYHHTSPLTDLPYFFTGSLDATTQVNHLHELIDIYYNSFIETLNYMHCDISPFTRESFECELKKQAINQLPLCALGIKFFVFEVDHDNNDNRGKELCSDVFDAEASDLYADKLKGLSEMYERMGWF